mmetsp:Transcript_6631/g.13113  ORF Transcript_6631/g.13113 Transcript_6631/m.13113 type:complete len:111 (-) Transcript_6631:291-623(-)
MRKGKDRRGGEKQTDESKRHLIEMAGWMKSGGSNTSEGGARDFFCFVSSGLFGPFSFMWFRESVHCFFGIERRDGSFDGHLFSSFFSSRLSSVHAFFFSFFSSRVNWLHA